MSVSTRLLAGSALALAGVTTAQAQSASVSGLIQAWYTQMLDQNLRLNNASVTPTKYYNLRSEFQENGFSLRRVELKFSGKVTDEVSYEAMIDPTISSGSILQDAALVYKAPMGVEIKVGQFKNLQTLEGSLSSSELMMAERSQMGRTFGDDRNRGGIVSVAFGDPKGFGTKFHVGVFNGSGKANDSNAQKDLVARVDFNVGRDHRFGVYTLQGSTNVKDTTGNGIAPVPPTGWPTQQAIFENKDKTSNLGAFYQYAAGSWHASVEGITGLLGRRFPTLAASAPTVGRQHLDQKFLGYVGTLGYTVSNHTIAVRYDSMGYNSGGQWYTAYNPYKETAPGVPAATDYTPKFQEITVGYTYAFKADKVKAANLKVNYINRSTNFLRPLTGTTQTTEQGGDSVLVAFQIAF